MHPCGRGADVVHEEHKQHHKLDLLTTSPRGHAGENTWHVPDGRGVGLCKLLVVEYGVHSGLFLSLNTCSVDTSV